ncbi:MAG: proteobacterial dedicated sortase system response regulator [bacterium]
MQRTIAIVEDEPAIRDNYAAMFTRQGYRVATYANRMQAQQGFSTDLPDLVILDIGLDDEIDAGLDLCRELRARSASLAILFLTARDSDLDSIVGLRLGADDYLSKNISLEHLAARVAALMRRLEILNHPPVRQIRVDELTLDPDRMTVEWRQTAVPLTVTEFWILHALVEHPGHVRTRDQLMEAANIYVDTATVNSHIKRIRQKFLSIDSQFNHIDAVYGAGYRWQES